MRVLFLGDVGVVRAQSGVRPWPPPLSVDADTRIIVNWELPIGAVSKRYKSTQLSAPPNSVDAIRAWGGTVASLSNNHALDAGAEGLLGTANELKAAGVQVFGYRHLGVGDYHAWRWAHAEGRLCVLSWVTPETTPIPSSLNGVGPAIWPGLEDAAATVRDAKRTHDWVVAYVHWDIEYFSGPAPEVRGIARGLAEAGADLIIGHHPHVVRGSETVGSTPVFYSLGNYYFDDLPPDDRGIARRQVRQARQSIGILATFQRDRPPAVEVLSFIHKNGWPPERDVKGRGGKRLAVASQMLRECTGDAYEQWYRSALSRFMSIEYRWRFRTLSLTAAGALKLLRWRVSQILR